MFSTASCENGRANSDPSVRASRSVNAQAPLRQLFETYHRSDYLASDPLEFVHRYSRPEDQEIVALLAALTAYGNVKQIRASVSHILSRLESWAGSPERAVRRLRESDATRELERVLAGYKHRFNDSSDWVRLLRLAEFSLRSHGSLGGHFAQHHSEGEANIAHALTLWIEDWRNHPIARGAPQSFWHLLSTPKGGSACKRWCMFLRWMGRRDLLDLGLWTEEGGLSRTIPRGRHLHSRQLVIPVDTHVGRISQYIGLTKRTTLNWRTALEITSSLEALSPGDPTQFDFALARLGILDQCRRRFDATICTRCPLLPACRFAARRGKLSPQ